jgi:hypothetical protein
MVAAAGNGEVCPITRTGNMAFSFNVNEIAASY